MYSWTWVPDLKLYKLFRINCSYAIAKITLLVLFAFCILAEFISSSLYFVSVLSVPWNSAQRKTEINTHRHTEEALHTPKTIKTFLKTFAHFFGLYRLRRRKKTSTVSLWKNSKKRKKGKVKWICWLEHEKHFCKNTHIRNVIQLLHIGHSWE